MIKLGIAISLIATASFASVKDIEYACGKYKVQDCNLVKAVAWVESRFKNVNLVDNGSLSYGLMQVKCAAARDVGLKHSCKQLKKKMLGLRFGIKYLQLKLNKYKDIQKAIVSYNAYRPIVCKKYNPGKCYPGEYINQGYLIKVMRYYNYLQREELWTVLHLPIQMKEAGLFHINHYTKDYIALQKISHLYQATTMSSRF